MFADNDFFDNDDAGVPNEKQGSVLSRVSGLKNAQGHQIENLGWDDDNSLISNKTERFIPHSGTISTSDRKQITITPKTKKGGPDNQNFLYGGEDERKPEGKPTKTVNFGSRPKESPVYEIHPIDVDSARTNFDPNSNRNDQTPNVISSRNEGVSPGGDEKHFLSKQKQKLIDHQRLQNPNGVIRSNEFQKFRNQEPSGPLYSYNEEKKTIDQKDIVYDVKKEDHELELVDIDSSPAKPLKKNQNTPKQPTKVNFDEDVQDRADTEKLMDHQFSDREESVIQDQPEQDKKEKRQDRWEDMHLGPMKTPDLVVQTPEKEDEKPIPKSRLINVRTYGIPELIDVKTFIMNPVPKGYIVKCSIERDRKGFTNFYYKYHLTLWNEQRIIMSAKKRAGNKSSNYAISLEAKDYNVKSPNYLGKLRSNFMGTEYNLWDDGMNPKKTTSMGKLREHQGVFLYEANIIGKTKPRKMKVLLPKVAETGERRRLQPKSKKEGLLTEFKSGNTEGLLSLINKPPIWNEDIQGYVLSFGGRVEKASVKNFQIIEETNPDKIYLLFGKYQANSFVMDFQWPLSPYQAFSICLSSFDYKIGCE